MNDDTQRAIDTFYWSHGRCCAGCDHWRSFDSRAGECRRSAPMPGADRLALLGMESATLKIGAGHAFTLRDHECGEFADTFDWKTLPLGYRRNVGCPA